MRKKPMIQTVRVAEKGRDTRGQNLLHDIHSTLGFTEVTGVKTVKVYRLEGIDPTAAEKFARAVLVETISQTHSINRLLLEGATRFVEVGYKPGVMNPEIASILKSAEDKSVDEPNLKRLVAADTSMEYHFFGYLSNEQLLTIQDRLLFNKTVERIIDVPPVTLVVSGKAGEVLIIPIRGMSDDQLVGLSESRQLFLNLEEMMVIRTYFQELGRDPTDIELETLAQTWSEHCGHKTFKARLVIDGREKAPLFTRIKNAAAPYMQNVVRAFDDNAGVLRFYDGLAVSAKVETHNSPSAIDPYGGAMTGTGGVFRDPMGTGLGSKVIHSTDMFCLGSPWLSMADLPKGCIHPRHLFRKVVQGVADYGNRVGVPTGNGSVTFDFDFRAKPSIIVGAYGIAPEEMCIKGQAECGDIIYTVGGRTGLDGIHGATFSSGEMTAETITVNSSAVQIGNPIEEKRTSDALLICRDSGLIRALTDCGAGGFSSAIGEMGEKTGVWVSLSNAPLKYTGLSAWEIWVSESQERMICAVAPEHAKQFEAICKSYNVEATVMGEFMDDGVLTIEHDGAVICSMDMDFVHNGLPQRIMKTSSNIAVQKPVYEIPYPNWLETYSSVMGHLDVCSKQPVVKKYDHGVQGSNALPPFSGVHNDGPNDAVVLAPVLGKPYGLVISHGMSPKYMRIDPYNGALWAFTEALANLVAVGGNPAKAAMVNNYIWPFPDSECLAALDSAVEGVCMAMKLFQIPVISGKDSLSSTYRFPDGTILEIPPVLCMSAFGRIRDVGQTISADFKQTGSQLVFLGFQDIYSPYFPGIPAMDGSVYQSIQPDVPQFRQHEYNSGRIPMVDRNRLLAHMFKVLHSHILLGRILACHDVSQGGLAATIAEMCFGGDIGADINLGELGPERPDFLFFNETAGCFLLELPANLSPAKMFGDLPHFVIGKTIPDKVINVHSGSELLVSASVDALRSAWKKPMEEVFQ